LLFHAKRKEQLLRRCRNGILMTEKTARIGQCLKRAGMVRIPASDGECLATYGLDSLLSVMAVIEMQKEFEITISAEAIKADSFSSILALSKIIPD
jgi:hypothetical protein